jgi:hypothetical protein
MDVYWPNIDHCCLCREMPMGNELSENEKG